MSEENQFEVPLNNTDKRKSEKFLPTYYRTDSNKKFLAGTIDNLIQRGTAKKLNGYIGRQNSKANIGTDIFLDEVTSNRAAYQLEPCLVYENYLGDTVFYKDYIDYINNIEVLGGIVNNHQRLNKEEFYSWNPHINWDKFVNYLQYYWLPYGPEAIPFKGTKTLDIVSTLKVELVDEGDNFAYLFTPDALTRNPDLRLYRGETYRFEINAPDHPFSIKTERVSSGIPNFYATQEFNFTQHGENNFVIEVLTDTEDVTQLLTEVYINGVKLNQDKFTFVINENNKKVLILETNITTNDVVIVDFFKIKLNDRFRFIDGIKTYEYVNNKLVETKNFNVKNGVLELKISPKTPDLLYYVSETNPDTSGIIKIFDLDENTTIDVENEIVGKKDFFGNGLQFSNGMKIRFRGIVYPEFYRDKDFYVEGVGSAIKLIDVKTLEEVTDLTYNVPVNFDQSGFDQFAYNNISYAALDKEYITINRSSLDRNAWSRYNRWFHKDIIETTARILGKQPIFDQTQRAIRPIIEFEPNLRLFNFGNRSKKNIDLFDDFTKDVFSIVEGSLGYNVDGQSLINGHRVIFTADTDPKVKNKVFRVEYLNIYEEDLGLSKRRIHLVEEEDTDPLLDQTVLVLGGNTYSGKMFWFNGTTWTYGQQKLKLNQSPLFDLFDKEGFHLNDTSKYEGSNFKGCRLFSYNEGEGSIDKELGFSLTYKNINNIGDIVFDFNLATDIFKYKIVTTTITDITSNKFLQILNTSNEKVLVNGWEKNVLENTQPVIRVYKNEYELVNTTNKLIVNDFPLDMFDDKDNLDDLRLKVYINGKRLDFNQFQIRDGVVYKLVKLAEDITENDVVTLKCYTSQPKNANGYYEFPLSFQNNPLNENVESFTLGEVIDHVDSIIDSLDNFKGVYPGPGNLRDIGNLTERGTKFIQHSGSMNLSLYHLTDNNANILKAIDMAMNDYNKFKRSFIFNSEYLEDIENIKVSVDDLLRNINLNKTKSMPYYFSDMLAYNGQKHTQFKIKEFVQDQFPLSRLFNLNKLSTGATYIYVNNQQLLYKRDYEFTDQGFVKVFVKLKEDDIVDMFEYDSTDGCFIPPTPTSLGLYPKFEPKKYLDTTLQYPQNVIQGHDGSIIAAFDDFRDDLILELEKRIFNNIKIEYDPNVIDIYDYIEGSNRNTDYSKQEFNQIISSNFFKWTLLIDQDFSRTVNYKSSNPFTYNYSECQSFDKTTLDGYWRGIYKWYFDTDRIHIAPWESLGFSIKPKWWDEVYGLAPYTSDNYVLWNDLRDGVIREPNKPLRVNSKFVKPILDNIPTTDQGALLDPIATNIATGLFNNRVDKNYIFGDIGPVENAWRRSSYYSFCFLKNMILMTPNKVFSVYFDRSRIERDPSDQLVYTETGLRLQLKDLKITSVASDSERIQTSGLVNYVVDYLLSNEKKALSDYKTILSQLTNKLSHRISGYTSEEKFNLILDSRNVNSKTSVFVPKENYKVILNTSSPTKKLFYSGVIVTKVVTKLGLGYEIKGYSLSQPYFYYFPWTKKGYDINVGGISESFIVWEAQQRYVAGNIVRIGDGYYRVKTSHTSSSNPSYNLLAKLAALPIVGGADANIRSEFDPTPTILTYGSIIYSKQEVVDFLLGYQEYLKSQGFIFTNYISEINSIGDWSLSVKEFLFWTTQNWSAGSDSYRDWLQLTNYLYNDIVLYNRQFYRTIVPHISQNNFEEQYFLQIDNINSDGASAISLSPSALEISVNLEYNVVNDILNSYEYEIFRADGGKYKPEDLNFYRENGKFIVKPKNTELGIYGLGLYLVQKEHVLIIDNVTQFNDVIFNKSTGYRQERLKVYGYKTIDWNGSFDSPGFVYDEAHIQEWTSWIDYNIGDIVKYKEFYYSALTKIIGSENFDNTQWNKLATAPESKLIPNWDYKSLQFLDFYDLDSDNFDIDQQRIAQHLIGYQKRQYLSNIIKNDVSEFKFYQGMITEKGTVNSLNKLFDVLSSDGKDSFEFLEEWAIRVGRFGSTESYDEVEFALDETFFKLDPQPFEIVDEIDPSKNDFVIRYTANDIYLKPKNYDKNLWPVDDTPYPLLKTPGFCKVEMAKVILDDLSDLITMQEDSLISPSDLVSGDYVWCGFQKKINQFNDDWNIFRYNKLYSTITNVVVVSNQVQFTYNIFPNIQVNDILAITSDYDKLFGFYIVTAVDAVAKTFKIAIPVGFQLNNLNIPTVITYNFTEHRFSNIDNLLVPKYINLEINDWPYGELAWISNESYESIWKNKKVYKKTNLSNYNIEPNQEFGYRVSTNSLTTLLLVTLRKKEVFKYNFNLGTSYTVNDVVFYPTDGKFYVCISNTTNVPTDNLFWTETTSSNRQVLVYSKPYLTPLWVKKQLLFSENNVFDYGDVTAVSEDFRFIAISGIRKRNATTLERVILVYSIPQQTLVFNSDFTLTTGNRLDYLNNRIVINQHGLADGTLVKLTSLTNTIVGTEDDQEYYVKVIDSNSFILTKDVELQEVLTLKKSLPGVHYLTNLKSNQDYTYKTTIIKPGNVNLNFGTKLKFIVKENPNPNLVEYNLFVNCLGDGLYIFNPVDASLRIKIELVTPSIGFCSDFDVSKDYNNIVISDAVTKKVYVYNNSYSLIQTVENTVDRFGHSVSISSNNQYLAVGANLEDTNNFTNQGAVRIYKKTSGNFALFQTINNRNAESNEEFGYQVKFVNDDNSDTPKTLVILSRKGDAPSIDVNYTNITDSNFLTDVGRVDIFDRYNTKFIFSESLSISPTVTTEIPSITIGDNTIIIGNHNLTNSQNSRDGVVYIHEKKRNTYSWNEELHEKDPISLDWFKKIFLYNRKNNNLITYLDIINPKMGKIAGIAEQEIKFKTYYDPANYSYKNSGFISPISVDDGLAWTDAQVGMLWWDLRRAKFLDATIGDVVYNNSVWNTLFPTASIDVYEWVESRFLPSQWDELADTVDGISLGISGLSLYGDKAYSIKKSYDNLSNKVNLTYYFWVKNKKIIPNKHGRKIASIDCTTIIENPKNANIKYIKFLDKNAFSLANVTPLLDKDNILLSLQYWIQDPKNLQVHNEYKIISNNEKTSIPPYIEKKWFDSLIGFDDSGVMLPRLNIPPKLRYGIEFNPNQTMFVNRLEAVKLLVEKFNNDFKSIQVDNIDLSDFYIKDEIPHISFGLYDYIKDVYGELRFVVSQRFVQAKLEPVVFQGKITQVKIIEKGYGYQVPPSVTISGTGTNAELKLTINSVGSITNVEVLNKGLNYSASTTITVRPLSVVVRSDENTLNEWAIYHFINNNWVKVKTKDFDVTKYWYFIDWYEDGYNQFTKINHLVNDYDELLKVQSNIGDIVKVNNIGSSDDWVLALKISNDIAVDYTQIYRIVGRKNGAIQLSTDFYNFRINDQGYDGLLYDSDLYDRVGSQELRIILNSLKNKILVDNRRKIYIDLFFASIRYILKEQPFVDWIFKTSFIKVLHFVGPLRQKVNFNNDNLEDYESYIKEVKPFRTKIREFVSVYDTIESSNSLITDFDLPSYINKTGKIRTLFTQFEKNSVFIENENLFKLQPWNSWLNNTTFNVAKVQIIDQGEGYTSYPTVEITGECTRPLKIKFYINRGKIVQVDILDPGEGYYIAPQIRIRGQFTETGREASVYAILGNSLIRNSRLAVKFDRYEKESIDDVLNVNVIDTFTGDGSTITFELRYSPDIDRTKFKVFVDNVEIFVTEYEVQKLTSQKKGYTVYYGSVTFDYPPGENLPIRIEYQKDFNNLNALERIKHFYKPTAGMLGIDFDQLMTGIDYGGVSISSIGFSKLNLWDGEFSWASKGWDSGEPTDDEIYDTIIEGGNLAANPTYRTASGIRADDIIIDGDGFITPMTSPAPEEMIPGHVADTLAIKVFERNITVTSEINCIRYITDGVTKEFKLTSYPNNEKAIIVKLNDDILIGDDYYFDYNNLNVILLNTPPAGQNLSILGFGFNGTNLITIDSIVATEENTTIVLDADYQDNISVYTVVAGKPISNIPFKTRGAWQSNVSYKLNDEVVYQTKVYQSLIDNNFSNLPLVYSQEDRDFVVNSKYWVKILDDVESYIKVGKIGVTFPEVLNVGDVVLYSVFLGSSSDQSILTREIITTDGVNQFYRLDNIVGYKTPLGPNTLVRVGDTILDSVDQFRFILKNRQVTYPIPLNKGDLDVYSTTDYEVFINSIKVPDAIAYSLNLLEKTITIKPNYYKENAEVTVSITKFAEYRIDNDLGYSRIRLRTVYPLGTQVEILAMTNHDLLDIGRFYLTIEKNVNNLIDSIYYPVLIEASGGVLYFDTQIKNSNYVWVTKNQKLLVPLTDYILREDRRSIRFTETPNEDDRFGIITFSSNVNRIPVRFMIFKDMLNNYSYIRLNKNRTTRLLRNLNATDKDIYIEDSSVISEANRISNVPGVVYINGERIEYMSRIGNKITELRRGTMGTGVPKVHKLGTEVYDIGFRETVPYKDETKTYKWLGIWDPNYRYLQDEVVNYNGQSWQQITGINYKLWESSKTYILNQQVIYNEKLYRSKQNLNVSKTPNLEPTWWELVESDITHYPSVKNLNWARTDLAFLDDSSNTLVVPWEPIVDDPDSTTNYNKRVLDLEVFVGTNRLKKIPYSIHDKTISPHSPEGDISYAADLITDGVNHGASVNKDLGFIKLREDPLNKRITIVRKQGTVWGDIGKSLSESNNKIAEFLQIDVDTYEGTKATLDSTNYTFDSDIARTDEE